MIEDDVTLQAGPIKVDYHPVKFGGRSHSDSGDIVVLFFQVISQDHVAKGSRDFIGKSPSREVIILPSLVAIGTLTVET